MSVKLSLLHYDMRNPDGRVLLLFGLAIHLSISILYVLHRRKGDKRKSIDNPNSDKRSCLSGIRYTLQERVVFYGCVKVEPYALTHAL